MEEYFARQRRRRLIAIAVGLVVAIVAFVVVLFANFRTNSNYRFQSVADFFYQTLTSRKLTYDFVDQNISEVEVGPHVLRTMSVEIDGEIQLIQAVKLRTFWGAYYKFPLVSFEASRPTRQAFHRFTRCFLRTASSSTSCLTHYSKILTVHRES